MKITQKRTQALRPRSSHYQYSTFWGAILCNLLPAHFCPKSWGWNNWNNWNAFFLLSINIGGNIAIFLYYTALFYYSFILLFHLFHLFHLYYL